MAHTHNLKDADPHFRIDPVTRNIVNMSGKVVLVQHDHNSERFTFEIPKLVDGHDMSVCNNVKIHYINGNATEKNPGVYEVDDLILDEANDMVYCSWLISHNATRLIGPLSFMIRFECLTGDTIDYAWSTGVHSGITVSQGIYNTDDVVEDYVDVLEQWRLDLEAAAKTMTGIEQTIVSTEDSGVNEVTMSFSDGSTGTFTVQNGSRGLPGATGVSIKSITRTDGNGAAGTTDTYTITLTNGDTTTFQVYNGADGVSGDGAGDMVKSTYDPQGKATDIFAYVDTHANTTDMHVTADEKSKWNDKADSSDIPTKTSELENDSGYLTEHQSLDGYVKTDALGKLATKDSLTAADVGALPDTTNIPTVPTNVSAFTNDAGYLTTVPAEYVTDSELNAKGYLTQHQSLAGYAKTDAIPTKVSELTNDAGYLTAVPGEYVTEDELNAKGYLTEIPDGVASDHNHEGQEIKPARIRMIPDVSVHPGSFIDFYYNAQTDGEYTSRIWETISGKLTFDASNGIATNGNIDIETGIAPSIYIHDTTNNTAALVRQHINQLMLINQNTAGSLDNSRTLTINNSKLYSGLQHALRLADSVNGTTTEYDILHTGNLADSMVCRIQKKTYTGTSVYGEANPNTLTFEFEPKFVIIDAGTTIAFFSGSDDTTGMSKTLGMVGTENFSLYHKISGRTLTWYSEDSTRYQLNSVNSTYNVIAFG